MKIVMLINGIFRTCPLQFNQNEKGLKFEKSIREMCKELGHISFTPFKDCPNYTKKNSCWKKYAKIREKNLNTYEEDKL
jgi:uncharacterized OB-fold protein